MTQLEQAIQELSAENEQLKKQLEEEKSITKEVMMRYAYVQVAAFNLFVISRFPHFAAQIESNEVLKMVFQNLFCEIAENRDDLEVHLKHMSDKDSAQKMLSDSAQLLDYYQKFAAQKKQDPELFRASVNNQNVKPLKS